MGQTSDHAEERDMKDKAASEANTGAPSDTTQGARDAEEKRKHSGSEKISNRRMTRIRFRLTPRAAVEASEAACERHNGTLADALREM